MTGQRFSVRAVYLWNKLPIHIRDSISIKVFKKETKKYLFENDIFRDKLIK